MRTFVVQYYDFSLIVSSKKAFFVIQQTFILMTSLSASPVTITGNFQYIECIPLSLKTVSS